MLIVCFCFTSFVKADTETDQLWAGYNRAKNISEKVHFLGKIGHVCILNGDNARRDSFFNLAVQANTFNDTALYSIYKAYFDEDYDYLSVELAQAFADNMLVISKNANNNKLLYEAYLAAAKLHTLKRENELALDNATKAFYHVALLQDERLKARCMLQMGFCQERANKKIDAFRNYMDALYISQEFKDDSLRFDCNHKLYSFYYFLKKYDKAKDYKKKQLLYLVSREMVDSANVMYHNIALVDILFHNNEAVQAKRITKDLIKYSVSHDYRYIKDNAFGLYRTYLIDNGQFNELRDLYEKEYPGEYKRIAAENNATYYRLNGYILEANGKPDSAEFFYQRAEASLRKNNGHQCANFYKRYGEFLLRRNNVTSAIQKFDSAYKYALSVNYFPFLIETSHYLDSLNYLQKNVDKAYQFAVLNKHYTEQQAEANKGEEMLQLEVENEARQQELRAEQEERDTERRHNLQYTAMVIAIIGIFILLTALGTFKVHPTYIRVLGFFSFIFFFEFIIMIADHQIHHFTHGEPWKFMAFKIVLIAMLLPLHHWLEEKVIHYLVHHHLLDTSKFSFKMPALKRKSKPEVAEKPSEN